MSGERRRPARRGRCRASRARSTPRDGARSRPRTGSSARLAPERGCDRFDLGPGLKGTLLLAPRSRVVDTDLRRIEVDLGERRIGELTSREIAEWRMKLSPA